MDTNKEEQCYDQQVEAVKSFAPDVVIGSSFGGHIAVRLLLSGILIS